MRGITIKLRWIAVDETTVTVITTTIRAVRFVYIAVRLYQLSISRHRRFCLLTCSHSLHDVVWACSGIIDCVYLSSLSTIDNLFLISVSSIAPTVCNHWAIFERIFFKFVILIFFICTGKYCTHDTIQTDESLGILLRNYVSVWLLIFCWTIFIFDFFRRWYAGVKIRIRKRQPTFDYPLENLFEISS